MMPTLQAVMETVFTMTVSINDLSHLILFSHSGEFTIPFHYVSGRMKAKHFFVYTLFLI